MITALEVPVHGQSTPLFWGPVHHGGSPGQSRERVQERREEARAGAPSPSRAHPRTKGPPQGPQLLKALPPSSAATSGSTPLPRGPWGHSSCNHGSQVHRQLCLASGCSLGRAPTMRKVDSQGHQAAGATWSSPHHEERDSRGHQAGVERRSAAPAGPGSCHPCWARGPFGESSWEEGEYPLWVLPVHDPFLGWFPSVWID